MPIARSEYGGARLGDSAAENSSTDDGSRVRVYTVEQVAEILQVSRDKVYMLLRTGRLRSIKIDRLRRITDRQLDDFIASVERMP
ncbi:helix-turn-helix domain-containing protein [Actinomadura verrucosospora]